MTPLTRWHHDGDSSVGEAVCFSITWPFVSLLVLWFGEKIVCVLPNPSDSPRLLDYSV
jgi:hypothetical protein